MKTAKEYIEECLGDNEANIKAEAHFGTPYKIYEDTFDDLVEMMEQYANDYYQNKLKELSMSDDMIEEAAEIHKG